MIAAAADARDVAREILHERRFHDAPFPQPLRRPLHSLGDALRPIGRALTNAFDWLAGITPGGGLGVWLVLAAVAAGVTALLVRHGLGRSGAVRGERGERGADGATGPSRRDLEREAQAAEQAGDFDAAVRLRFGAGLLGLAERGVIEERASLRNGEVAASLRSDDFDAIARAFDEVVYGGREALSGDALQAREGWRDVLHEVRR